MSDNQSNNPSVPAGPGDSDEQSVFGAVNDADITFTGGSVDDATAQYTAEGFGKDDFAATDDRLTPERLFARAVKASNTHPAPLAPAHAQQPAQPPAQPPVVAAQAQPPVPPALPSPPVAPVVPPAPAVSPAPPVVPVALPSQPGGFPTVPVPSTPPVPPTAPYASQPPLVPPAPAPVTAPAGLAAPASTFPDFTNPAVAPAPESADAFSLSVEDADGHFTAETTPGDQDYLSIDQPPVPSTIDRSIPAPSRTKKVAVRATAGIAALAVLGGGFLTYQKFFGPTGPQPAAALPGNAIAYASIDFNPSTGEKVDVYNLLKKFPTTKSKFTSKDNIKDGLLGDVLGADLKDSGYDYNTDIKPWIGDRAGIAAVPDAKTGEIGAVAAVEYTDKSKAEAALSKMAHDDPDNSFYGFTDNYVLLTDSKTVLDQALHTSQHLSENKTFAHDTKALGGTPLFTGWVDASALVHALPAEVTAQVPTETLNKVKGSAALGLNAESDYLELQAHSFGADTAAVSKAGHLQGTLPGDADAALEVTGVGAALNNLFTDVLPSLPEGDQAMLDQAISPEVLNLVKEASTVFGTDFAAAVAAPAKDGAEPQIAISADTSDPAKAKSLLSSLADEAGLPLTIVTTPDGYTAATKAWSTDATAGSGDLTNSSAFKKAVEGAQTATSYGYVNISNLASAIPGNENQKDLAALQAIGFSTHVDGDHTKFDLRITVK